MKLGFWYLFTLFSLAFTPLLGSEFITPVHYWQPAGLDGDILWSLRLPRALAGLLAGAGLALGGLAFQALFQNPLATPFTLGVASGAGVGAALWITLAGGAALAWLPGSALAGLAGALLTAYLVYSLTRLKEGFSTASLLLAGVAVNLFGASLILLIQHLSGVQESHRILRWMMGGLNRAGWGEIAALAGFVGLGSLVLIRFFWELDLLSQGEDLAWARGVNVERVKALLFFAVSLILAGQAAFLGPIGFVGLMAPHAARMLGGTRHQDLVQLAPLLGALLLLWADALSRMAFSPAEVPVGILTALMGGPFFLYLLLGQGGRLFASGGR